MYLNIASKQPVFLCLDSYQNTYHPRLNYLPIINVQMLLLMLYRLYISHFSSDETCFTRAQGPVVVIAKVEI